jgi:hypothetical protein
VALERVFAAAPAIGARNQVIAAPSQFLFTGTESLRLTVFRMAVGVTIALQGRFRDDASGVARPFNYDVPDAAINSDGDTHEYTFPAGQLLNVRIGGHEHHVAVRVHVRPAATDRRHGAGAVIIGTMLQGYFSVKSDLAWPGSPIQHVHEGRGVTYNVGWATVTGASLYANRSAPIRHRYQIVGGRVDVLTSAVVAPRNILLSVQDTGGTVHHIVGASTTLGGSAGRTICFGAGMPARAIDIAGVEWLPIAQDVELTSSLEVRVQVTNNQVGDTITAQGLLVRDWFDD